MALVGRDRRHEGLGPRPRTSRTREGGVDGPRSGDSLSSLTTLYGSLSQGSIPRWREIAGLGGVGEGGSVYLVCSMCQALHEVCFIRGFMKSI